MLKTPNASKRRLQPKIGIKTLATKTTIKKNIPNPIRNNVFIRLPML